MDKVRIHEIAKELAAHSKDVVDKAIEMGLNVKSAQSTLSMEEAEKLMNYVMSAPAPKPQTKKVSVKKQSESDSKEAPEAVAEVKANEPKKAETEDVSEKKEAKTPKEDKATEKPQVAEVKVVKPETRRKGLTIVKKKRPISTMNESQKTATPTKSSDEKIASNYGKMSEEARLELERVAKRKAKRRQETQKHEQGEKLDIIGFGEGGYDIEAEQVQLIDYRDEQAKLDYEEQLKKEALAQKAAKAKQTSKRKVQTYTQNRSISRGTKKKRRRKVEEVKEQVSSIEIPEDIRVYEFAEKINKSVSEVMSVLFNLGMMVTKNDFLGKDEIEILAEEFEVEVHTIDLTEEFNYEKEYEKTQKVKEEGTAVRAPIVTIMGHVDHGKTSLLDYIRNSRIAAKEAGGITQHIGAYSVDKAGKMITFLDTPGHAAFSAMRSRGADLTDIIIIVVAADDGVKPQTLEAIKLAKESGAPIIVALNKMDKEGVQPDMVKGQMAEHGLNPADWGGDTDFVPLSAKTGEGVEELLETILLQADLLELKASPELLAKATVVESSIQKGRGPVATIVMQNGSLNVGDNIVAAASHGRVKMMLDANGKPIKKVGPAETCVVVGLDSVPAAGEVLISTESEKEAKSFAQKRYEHDRHKELSVSTKASLDELTAMIAEGNLKALKIILKADVHGSLEAIKSSLEVLRNDEVKVSIISSAVGGITQNDIDLASNSDDVIILGFNVRPTGSVNASAKQRGVQIKTYSVIYEMIDDVTAILSGMMNSVVREENTGQAVIKEIFSVPKGGKVAGCVVEDGKVVRGGKIRVIREGVVIHVTTVASLRRFKDEVKEVGKGYECGIMLDNFNEIAVGDVFETFVEIEESATL